MGSAMGQDSFKTFSNNHSSADSGVTSVSQTVQYLERIPWAWSFTILVLCGYLVSIVSVHFLGPKAPLVGLGSVFEPRIIGNWRFFKNASKVIEEGYSQVWVLTLKSSWMVSI